MSGRTVADLVLSGGRVWCGLGLPSAEALAFHDGRVLATGSVGDIAGFKGPGTRVIELAGRLVVPGLNDAHMHLLPYGLAMRAVDLRPKVVPTLEALLEAVSTRAATTPAGDWITGRGYDHFKLDTGRHPTREELDAAAPDNPVYIVRTCGHLAVANTRALALAGIDEGSPTPQGGLIEKKDGRLTGLLAETAREPVIRVLPQATTEDLVEAIERAGTDLLSYGITSCMDAAVGMSQGWIEMEAYQLAHRTGRLPLRVYACLIGDKGRNIVSEAFDAGMVTGSGDDRLRIGPVKIFTDGSAGGRTAAMTRPYLGGGADDLGLLCLDADALNAMVLDYHRKGYQMAIHAIGDAAIDQVLDAYDAALDDTPAPDRRHRIEHCGWLRPDQMDRMVARHILPAPQPAFLWWFGDLYLTIAEAERVESSHPMRTWIDRGLHPSASTDCPVVEIDPMPNLYTMVTRRTERGTLLGPDQCLGIEEALHAYTSDAAYASGEEAFKGRLEPGMLGDAAVFDRDFVGGAPETILQARCDMTVVGGEIVWTR